MALRGGKFHRSGAIHDTAVARRAAQSPRADQYRWRVVQPPALAVPAARGIAGGDDGWARNRQRRRRTFQFRRQRCAAAGNHRGRYCLRRIRGTGALAVAIVAAQAGFGRADSGCCQPVTGRGPASVRLVQGLIEFGTRGPAFRRGERIALRVRQQRRDRDQQGGDATAHRGWSVICRGGSVAPLSDSLPAAPSLTCHLHLFKKAMASRSTTSPSRARRGDQPEASVPASGDTGENSASELIEAPQGPGRDPLDAHDFADGGGGGGAEAFRRTRRQKPRR